MLNSGLFKATVRISAAFYSGPERATVRTDPREARRTARGVINLRVIQLEHLADRGRRAIHGYIKYVGVPDPLTEKEESALSAGSARFSRNIARSTPLGVRDCERASSRKTTALFLPIAKPGIKRFATQTSNWRWTTSEARNQTGRQTPD